MNTAILDVRTLFCEKFQNMNYKNRQKSLVKKFRKRPGHNDRSLFIISADAYDMIRENNNDEV